MKKLDSLGEFGLINWIRRQSPKDSFVIKGIGDDTAVLKKPSSDYLLFTTDMIVEGTHFLKNEDPQKIGHKAIAVNVSDIAAMGGLPCYAVVSLGISGKHPVSYAQKIYQGMFKVAKRFGVSIVGGDTVKSDKLIINVAMIGRVSKKDVVTRSGAKRGDQIFVTGPLGNSLKSGHHLTFTPRVKESQFLVKHFKPTAMIDISDGLSADLGHILEESKVGAVLYENMIPCRKSASLAQALNDGEDFELLFTLKPSQVRKMLKHKNFHRIGEITNTRKLQLKTTKGQMKDLLIKGFKHF